MGVGKADSIGRARADLVARDRDGMLILVAEVVARRKGESAATVDEAVASLIPYLELHGVETLFGMEANLDQIEVKKYKFNFNGSTRPARRTSSPVPLDDSVQVADRRVLVAGDVLARYDPEFGEKRIFGYYLVELVSSWLDDVAYHWKSEVPPGSDVLAEIGLLERLEGGATQKEVALRGDPVCRD